MIDTTPIPQAVWDHYHACYNNQTYVTFSLALATAFGLDERVVRLEMHDDHHNRLMNLLIDASMELVGAAPYAGAGQRLGNALGGLDDHTPTLVKLAAAHLDNFAIGECPWKVREKIAHMATLALVQQGRQDRLVERCTCYGGVQVWAITLDVMAWTRVIQDGLASGTIALP